MNEMRNPVTMQCDIMVVRGTLEGCAAAITSARAGKSVIMVEKSGSLGGMASNGLSVWMEPCAKDDSIAPIRAEILQRIGCADGAAGALYPDQKMKVVLGELLKDAGVTWLDHVFLSQPITEDGVLKGFFVNGKTGPVRIGFSQVIDASDTLETAGMLGLEQTSFSGKVSVAVKMNGLNERAVNVEQNPAGGKIGSLHTELSKQYGELTFACDELCVMLRDNTGEALVSGLTCTLPAFDPLMLSAAQIGLRRFAYDLRDHLRKSIPGMDKLNIIHVAPQLHAYGIRQCENIYDNLWILNNSSDSYSNRRALENGNSAAGL